MARLLDIDDVTERQVTGLLDVLGHRAHGLLDISIVATPHYAKCQRARHDQSNHDLLKRSHDRFLLVYSVIDYDGVSIHRAPYCSLISRVQETYGEPIARGMQLLVCL